MEKEIIAYMCKNFKEYDKVDVDRDPNLIFGDGECPAKSFIFHNKDNCSPKCKLYERLN